MPQSLFTPSSQIQTGRLDPPGFFAPPAGSRIVPAPLGVVELGSTGFTTANTATVTTSSFTPTAGSLLVAVCAQGNGTGGAASTGTVTDNVGGVWRQICAYGDANGVAEIWIKDAGASPSSQAVTYDPGGAGASGTTLIVRWVGNAKPAALQPGGTVITGIGATAYAAAVNNISAGSMIYGALGRAASAITPTGPVDGTTSLGSFNGSAGDTAAGFRSTMSTSSAGSPTLGFTNSPSGTQHLAIAEILPASADSIPNAVPAVQPPLRLRFRAAARRAKAFTPTAPPVAPAVPAFVSQPPRLEGRGLRLFRTRAAGPVPAQVVVAPPLVPDATRIQVRGLRLFRPRAAGPAPVQVFVAQPATPRASARGLRLLRSKAATAPSGQPTPPSPGRPRVRAFAPRRGEIAGPLPVQVVVPRLTCLRRSARGFGVCGCSVAGLRARSGADRGGGHPDRAGSGPGPAERPAPVAGRAAAPAAVQPVAPVAPRPRSRTLSPRRGRTAASPPAQNVVVAPAYPPQPARPRLRGLRMFRGRGSAPVPAQQIVVAPPVPPRLTRGRRLGFLGRRARASKPVPAQVILIAPTYPPVFARVKKRLARIFRGRAVTPIAEVCTCTTPRPSTGTTLRPGSGITARPGSGMTVRPGSGMTFRPDSGITERPCTCHDD